jgi:toxin ParE1/3/4
VGRVAWTAEAQAWLRDIHDFIARDQPEAARKVILGLLQRAQTLGNQPRLGRLVRHEADEEIRILQEGHYRIAYLIQASGRIVILGVLHDAMDLERYLP